MVTLRYGVIGCGMMGQEHLRNIALLKDAEIAAIFEPDEGMRARSKALAPKADFVGSIAELVKRQDVDCLLIASPNDKHLEQLEEIAAIRPLPVLVEKPLFTNAADTARVAALRKRYTAPIWVAMEYRYMPPVTRLIESVGDATGGVKMLTIREHRYPFLEKVGDWNRFNERTGGTLVEKCCHFFDLMRHIAQSDPVRVMASGGQAVNHLDERVGNRTPDIWDHAYAIVDFKSGLRAMLELCMFAEGSRYQEEISAVGPKGKIECLVPGPGRFWPAHLGAPPVPKVILSPRNPAGPVELDIPVNPSLLAAGDHNGSTFFQHQGFQRAATGQQKPDVTLNDGWWAVSMGLAAQRSAITGQAVSLRDTDYTP